MATGVSGALIRDGRNVPFVRRLRPHLAVGRLDRPAHAGPTFEGRTRPVSRRLSRLRRQRESITTGHGEDIYRYIEANLHSEVFLLLGKRCPIFYQLRPATTPDASHPAT
jgi:hypothetical protein